MAATVTETDLREMTVTVGGWNYVVELDGDGQAQQVVAFIGGTMAKEPVWINRQLWSSHSGSPPCPLAQAAIDTAQRSREILKEEIGT